MDQAQLPTPVSTPIILVLPVFNEEPNLRPLLAAIERTLSGKAIIHEIIVVDDGSTDGSAEILDGLAKTMRLQVIRHAANRGLGAAIRTGLLSALQSSHPNGLIFTMDADNSHGPDLILNMIEEADSGADVVIASRFQRGSQVMGVPAHRRFLSVMASLLLRTIFPTTGVRDFTCGFRAYRATVLQRTVEKYGEILFEADGFQCMVDLLLTVRSLRVRFAEVPVILRYDLKQGSSKMQVWRTIRKTLGLAFRRRLSL